MNNVILKTILTPKFLALFTFIALVIRRPDQILTPHIWVEDGAQTIPAVLQYGIGFIFMPVNGYLVIPSKLVTWFSLLISGPYYPEISTFLSMLVCVACVVAVAVFPTILRHRYICAAAIVLVPIDSEIFALPSYVFWITTIFAVLAALWVQTPTYRQRILQILSILIGGLSSPVIVALLPFFLARCFLFKKLGEIAAFLTALVVSFIQLTFISARTGTSDPSTSLTVQNLWIIFERFIGWFGFYPLKDWPMVDLFYIILLIFISIQVIKSIRDKNWLPPLLLCLTCSMICLSVFRSVASLTDPYEAGPRYFFFPYLFFSWFLISTIRNSTWNSWIAAALLVTATFNSLIRFPRHNDQLYWREELSHCIREIGAYHPVIHFNGNVDQPWFMEQLNYNDCLKLASSGAIAGLPLSSNSGAYFMPWNTVSMPNIPDDTINSTSNWELGRVPAFARLEGAKIYGSWLRREKDQAQGVIRLNQVPINGIIELPYITGPIGRRQKVRLYNGQELIFERQLRTTKSEWQLLKIVVPLNNSGPFTVELMDDGNGWGEWSGLVVGKCNIIKTRKNKQHCS